MLIDSSRRTRWFFFTNLLSFHPYTLMVTTAAEFLPYGWATTDLWCAQLITGFYTLVTHTP